MTTQRRNSPATTERTGSSGVSIRDAKEEDRGRR